MSIKARTKQAILRALHLEDWEINDETLAYEVPGWDSLSHVKVLLEVEKEYGIRFSAQEVMELESVGDLDRLVTRKTGASNA